MTQSTVAALLAHPTLGLTLAAGPADNRPIRQAAGVHTLADLEHAPESSLAVVIEAGTSTAGYAIDVALRHAAGRDLAAVVFPRPQHLSLTAQHIANRAHLPVLCADPAQDGTNLLLRLDRHLRGGAADALSRAQAAIRACHEAASGPDGIPGVLAAAGAAVGYRLDLVEAPPVDAHAAGAIVVGEQQVAHIAAAIDDDAGQVALPAIAAIVSRLRHAEIQRRLAPAMTRAEVIVQLLLSERAQLGTLTEQAYGVGLPVQRTHLAVWLRVDQPGGEAHSLARQRLLLQAAELTAMQVLNARPGMWHVANLSGNLLVVHTDQTAGADLYRRTRREVQALVATLTRDGHLVVTAGLGTPQPGADGLRQSVAEARVAADSAAIRGKTGTIADTDPTGLRRILADVYSSPLTRNLLTDMLAPLDALGPERARTGVETLAAYLDGQCSPKRTARALHLHPNAVTYRLRWITAALAIDFDDADSRFAYHLACRIRLLDKAND
ncbi:helix-turn-helix domain-containing protein [Micromonospora sp. CPCC 205371]|nr:helix-turn-helix domain-containing protein [Micromonospora sp. CPCC 205371]